MHPVWVEGGDDGDGGTEKRGNDGKESNTNQGGRAQRGGLALSVHDTAFVLSLLSSLALGRQVIVPQRCSSLTSPPSITVFCKMFTPVALPPFF